MAKDKSEPRQERYRKKVEGAGGKRVAIMLKPDAVALLDKLTARYGSQSAVFLEGMRALDGRNEISRAELLAEIERRLK